MRTTTSPIEQLLYVAMHTIARLTNCLLADPIRLEGKDYLFGLDISSQVQIGSYRVDFALTDYQYPRRGHTEWRQQVKRVLVECDSQQWHERSEKERRYEKSRDRALLRKGDVVFHYTGSEIHENPYLVAADILSHFIPLTKEDLYQQVQDFRSTLA
jgi:very-short-patch-repair endonuclease